EIFLILYPPFPAHGFAAAPSGWANFWSRLTALGAFIGAFRGGNPSRLGENSWFGRKGKSREVRRTGSQVRAECLCRLLHLARKCRRHAIAFGAVKLGTPSLALFASISPQPPPLSIHFGPKSYLRSAWKRAGASLPARPCTT